MPVAYGAQDVYLTVTLRSLSSRRSTVVTLTSLESIEQTFSGTVGFGKKVTSTTVTVI
jgi:hypothetical protein